jgi:hypothetical protein
MATTERSAHMKKEQFTLLYLWLVLYEEGVGREGRRNNVGVGRRRERERFIIEPCSHIIIKKMLSKALKHMRSMRTFKTIDKEEHAIQR